jgi:indoleamine 2,3-dioxygenase
MKEHNLFNYLVNLNNKLPLIFLLGIVAEVYKFRFRHFNFVKKYIMENTKYPVATGGTPIHTWLPNQLKAVMAFYAHIKKNIPSSLTSFESNLAETIDKEISEMDIF